MNMSENTSMWQFVLPKGWPHSGAIEILDDKGLVVGYAKNILTARRLVAGMNNLRGFNTAELEQFSAISMLLARCIKLQRLLRKHIWRRTPEGSEFCPECMVMRTSDRHLDNKLCGLLNAE